MFDDKTKKIILQLYKNLVKEQQKGSPLWSLTKPKERAPKLTGISLSTIKKWIKHEEKDQRNETFSRQMPTLTSFKRLDSFNADLALRKVKEMLAERIVITLRKLKKFLVGFPYFCPLKNFTLVQTQDVYFSLLLSPLNSSSYFPSYPPPPQ